MHYSDGNILLCGFWKQSSNEMYIFNICTTQWTVGRSVQVNDEFFAASILLTTSLWITSYRTTRPNILLAGFLGHKDLYWKKY